MITALYNQSLLDIAIQEEGSVFAVFDLAVANDLSVTDNLYPGQKLKISNSDFSDIDITNYFKGKKQMIATAMTKEDSELLNPSLGIGSMVIESTFIVR